jgi:hypothetical protein
MSQNSINNTIGSSASLTYINQLRSSPGQWVSYNDQTDTFGMYNSPGTPETNITANIGSICTDTTNGDLYLKSTDASNTGWRLVASAATLSYNVQVFTSNGTYTPTTGMINCLVGS